uniref:Uncharacterized protein n=1 Tax=Dechloromonas aromatica (strain RCB) TaxID=159087 RepID=Q47H53_DECAR
MAGGGLHCTAALQLAGGGFDAQAFDGAGTMDELRSVPAVPARLENADRWSAYIDPSMGSIRNLAGMHPRLDKQAGLLAGLESIKAQDFQQAPCALQTPPEVSVATSGHSTQAANSESGQLRQSGDGAALNIGSSFTNPKEFLLAVKQRP